MKIGEIYFRIGAKTQEFRKAMDDVKQEATGTAGVVSDKQTKLSVGSYRRQRTFHKASRHAWRKLVGLFPS